MKIFLWIAALIALPGLANAVTRYGQASGGTTNCTTMQNSATPGELSAAVGCLTPGDRLELKAGTYSRGNNSGLSQINIPSGSSGAHITITTFGSDVVVFDRYTRFNFYNSGTQYVDFVGSCTPFRGVNRTCTMKWDGTGTALTTVGGPSTPSEITGFFSYSDIQLNTIAGGGAHNITFDGVEVTNWAGTAVGPGDGNTFKNGRVHHNGNFFYWYTDANNPCCINTGGAYGFYVSEGRNTWDNMEIDNNGGYGIHFNAASGNANDSVLKYNIVHDNGTHPGTNSTFDNIFVSSGARNLVYGNLSYNNPNGYGIRIASPTRACTDCVVYNNTIYNVGQTVGANGLSIQDLAVRTLVSNNIVSNPASNPGVASIGNNGSSTTFTNNLCRTLVTNCSYGEAATFTFTDPVTGDFTIKLGSAAINNGANLGTFYSPDIANVARPTIGPWEIGAYEYSTLITTPPQLVLALPLDDGSSSIAVDVSGQKNNAILTGGATWDNAGKYGKAIALDGTGYLNIPASNSLALSQGMTLEMWVYPTASPAGLVAGIVHDRYVLYAASDVGYCGAPALAPMGGYVSSVFNKICATSIPPANQWSHLAVTFDGSTLTLFLNGNIVAATTSTDSMVQTSYPVTIGASEFGENFIGKIDEPRVYNYARTPAQIVSDMNTPLIGEPGKYVEIAAPVSVEISSASSIEISAD